MCLISKVKKMTMMMLMLMLMILPTITAVRLFHTNSLQHQQISNALPLSAVNTTCPCSDSTLCNLIQGNPIRKSGEVFGFINIQETDPASLNWTHISTVAWASSPEFMCAAHKHGARAVISSPSLDLSELHNRTKRKEWVQTAVSKVVTGYYDGMVFDYESPQLHGSQAAQTYAQVISDTRAALHAVSSSYQISTCVAWSPDNIDGRDYPMNALALASDLLYVMDYDTRSQIFDACIASANAPVAGMIRGIQRYLDLGIDAAKLVLGTPWYGYHYPCLEGTALSDRYCPIKSVPFRGVNCSDAAGNELDFSLIRNLFHSSNLTTSPVRRDTNMRAPFFNAMSTKVKGNVDQYWYDDAEDLRYKYAWARANNLGGVGPYCLNMLAANTIPEEAVEVWSSLDEYIVL